MLRCSVGPPCNYEGEEGPWPIIAQILSTPLRLIRSIVDQCTIQWSLLHIVSLTASIEASTVIVCQFGQVSCPRVVKFVNKSLPGSGFLWLVFSPYPIVPNGGAADQLRNRSGPVSQKYLLKLSAERWMR